MKVELRHAAGSLQHQPMLGTIHELEKGMERSQGVSTGLKRHSNMSGREDQSFSNGPIDLKIANRAAISANDEYKQFEQLNDEISRSIAALKEMSMKSNFIEGVSEPESARRR